MWKLIVISVLMASFMITTSNCIECYSCISKENPDCVNPEKHRLERVNCGLDALGHTKDFATSLDPVFSKIFEVSIQENKVPLNCLKQVTVVKGEEIVLRGCQLPKDNKLDVCKKVLELEKADAVVKHCSLCGTDGCNGGSRIQLGGHGAFVLLLLAILTQQLQ